MSKPKGDALHEPLISMSEVCKALGISDPRTAIAACERHGVPITEISPKIRGLTSGDFALLMARARRGSANGEHPPGGGVQTVTDAEASLLIFLREVRSREALRSDLRFILPEVATPIGATLPRDFVNAITAVLEDGRQ